MCWFGRRTGLVLGKVPITRVWEGLHPPPVPQTGSHPMRWRAVLGVEIELEEMR